MSRSTVADMRATHAAGSHFAVVTAWDRPTAEFAEAAGSNTSSLVTPLHRLRSATSQRYEWG